VTDLPDQVDRDVVVIGGCGHVGLPLALAFADRGARVGIYDVSEAAVAMVNAGGLPFAEPGAEEVPARVLAAGRLVASADPEMVATAEHVIVVIGTPVDEHLNPKQAAITRAEGSKQAAILQAEGRREAAFRDAEARERAAAAEAQATKVVSDAIESGSVNALNYFVAQKYVEAFGKLADANQQRTVIVPADFSGIAGSIAGVLELVRGAQGGPGPPAAPRQPTPPRPAPAPVGGGN